MKESTKYPTWQKEIGVEESEVFEKEKPYDFKEYLDEFFDFVFENKEITGKFLKSNSSYNYFDEFCKKKKKEKRFADFFVDNEGRIIYMDVKEYFDQIIKSFKDKIREENPSLDKKIDREMLAKLGFNEITLDSDDDTSESFYMDVDDFMKDKLLEVADMEYLKDVLKKLIIIHEERESKRYSSQFSFSDDEEANVKNFGWRNYDEMFDDFENQRKQTTEAFVQDTIAKMEERDKKLMFNEGEIIEKAQEFFGDVLGNDFLKSEKSQFWDWSEAVFSQLCDSQELLTLGLDIKDVQKIKPSAVWLKEEKSLVERDVNGCILPMEMDLRSALFLLFQKKQLAHSWENKSIGWRKKAKEVFDRELNYNFQRLHSFLPGYSARENRAKRLNHEYSGQWEPGGKDWLFDQETRKEIYQKIVSLEERKDIIKYITEQKRQETPQDSFVIREIDFPPGRVFSLDKIPGANNLLQKLRENNYFGLQLQDIDDFKKLDDFLEKSGWISDVREIKLGEDAVIYSGEIAGQKWFCNYPVSTMWVKNMVKTAVAIDVYDNNYESITGEYDLHNFLIQKFLPKDTKKEEYNFSPDGYNHGRYHEFFNIICLNGKSLEMEEFKVIENDFSSGRRNKSLVALYEEFQAEGRLPDNFFDLVLLNIEELSFFNGEDAFTSIKLGIDGKDYKRAREENKELIRYVFDFCWGNFQEMLKIWAKKGFPKIETKGLFMAVDPVAYLNNQIMDEKINQNDFAYSLSDWPEEWLEKVTASEAKLFYENIEKVFAQKNACFANYVETMITCGDRWEKAFPVEAKNIADLDFCVGLSYQSEEVRNWFFDSAEYIGTKNVIEFLKKFNNLTGESKYSNWHDFLLWNEAKTKLTAGELIAVIKSIETKDQCNSFYRKLAEYNRASDIKKDEPISSLEDLILRVELSVENIEEFPVELRHIFVAPYIEKRETKNFLRTREVKDLFDGKYDSRQPFVPVCKHYLKEDLGAIIKREVGSYKEKIKGTAANPQQLYYDLNELIKNKEIDGKKMKVADLFEKVPAYLEENIFEILKKNGVDIGEIFTATVHRKSDPEAWVCGNYTDCCMNFLTGKNKDYLFNEATQYFTIKKGDRIIAQSVLVDSIDKRDQSSVIVLDNIEVAHNYQQFLPILSNIYNKFWTDYSSLPVKIGTDNNDLIPTGANLERGNPYQHKKTLLWSDSRSMNMYNLPKLASREVDKNMIAFADLSQRNVEEVAKMEKEIYPDEMVNGKDRLLEVVKAQRQMEIPGAASSFTVHVGKNMAGYVVMLPEQSEIEGISGEAIHIFDMAVLPKFQNQGLAKKMLKKLLEISEIYNYPIEAETREKTSYAMLQSPSIKKMLDEWGFVISYDKKMEKYLGGEDFHYIRVQKK